MFILSVVAHPYNQEDKKCTLFSSTDDFYFLSELLYSFSLSTMANKYYERVQRNISSTNIEENSAFDRLSVIGKPAESRQANVPGRISYHSFIIISSTRIYSYVNQLRYMIVSASTTLTDVPHTGLRRAPASHLQTKGEHQLRRMLFNSLENTMELPEQYQRFHTYCKTDIIISSNE